MTQEHQLIKKVFDWLIENGETDSESEQRNYGFHNHGYDDEDLQEYVLYHADGHRCEFKKEHICDPHEDGFKWENYELNPNDFDKDGYQYLFNPSIDADGFKDISIKDLYKKLEI